VITIKLFEAKDWAAVWDIIEPVFRAGETYTYSPTITKEEAYHAWVEYPAKTYVAVDQNNDILGTYYLKENQPGLGSHVCNCGYIVAETVRGQGIASKMCKHSQEEARAQGFLAMQFNLVVETNQDAVRLWKKHGFEIIGTIPKAFNHPRYGLVDAHIMYKQLTS
jgi:ribosomal protein S18 acetylase RimI-like enzyme